MFPYLASLCCVHYPTSIPVPLIIQSVNITSPVFGQKEMRFCLRSLFRPSPRSVENFTNVAFIFGFPGS